MSIEQVAGLILLQAAISATVVLSYHRFKRRKEKQMRYRKMQDIQDRNYAINNQVDKNKEELQAIANDPKETAEARSRAKAILMSIDFERGRIN